MIRITANNGSPRSIVICFFFQILVRVVTRETCLGRSLRANNGSPFHRDFHLLHEKNVFRFPENGALFFEGKQRVSPFFHDFWERVVKDDGVRSIVSDRTSILSSEQS